MATITQRGRGPVRSLRGFLADSAYASLGLGGATVELVRSIDRIRVQTPRRAREIGRQAPERLLQLVGEGVSGTLGLPGRAAREFDDLARRGRDLAGAIRGSQASREAVDRTRTARSRVKAAGTSVGKAAEGAVQATERAATIVAQRTEPSEQREVQVQPPKAQVQPPRAQVRTRPTRTGSGTGRRPAARQAPPPGGDRGQAQTQTGPYEERTVEELQERARQLGIEGRASMTK
jgi:hypothetical protein